MSAYVAGESGGGLTIVHEGAPRIDDLVKTLQRMKQDHDFENLPVMVRSVHRRDDLLRVTGFSVAFDDKGVATHLVMEVGAHG